MSENQTSSLKSAAEIAKGDIEVMTLSESDVEKYVNLNELIDGLATGFKDMARGLIQTPERPEITIPHKGFMLSMPAWRKGSPMMVKMVNVFEHNLELDLPNHLAMINLFDENTGAPICIMDGTYITGVRTAASAVLSVRELARADAKIVTIVGAGVQGREHLKLLPLIGNFEKIFINSLHHEDAISLAALNPKADAIDNLRDAVEVSDVVCLASHSYEPVIQQEWVKPGTHISSVGYAPPQGEIPIDLIMSSKLYVEDDDSFKPTPVGCAELQNIDPATAIKLGDALIGERPLRENNEEIIVYKAMGIAMEDLVAAEIAYENALKSGFMKTVTM